MLNLLSFSTGNYYGGQNFPAGKRLAWLLGGYTTPNGATTLTARIKALGSYFPFRRTALIRTLLYVPVAVMRSHLMGIIRYNHSTLRPFSA
jgi:hypothetical protein